MKYFLVITFLFLSWVGSAQEITVSDAFSVRTDDTYDFIGKIKNQYLVFHDKGTEFEIKAFDTRLQSSWDKEIELEKRRANVLGVIAGKEDFSVVYTCRKKRKFYLFVNKFSPAGNVLDTALVKDFGTQFISPNFEVIRSEDKKTILIYEVKEQKKINAIAFNLETMQTIWTKSFEPEDMKYYEGIEQMLVSNHGDFFVILKKDNRKAKKEKHRYEIHRISPNNEYTYSSVSMEGHLTYDILFSYDNKNDLLMAGGLYSDKNRGRANGYFFMRIPPEDPDNAQLTFIKFEAETVDNLIGKKADVEKGIADLDVREIVHRHDGGALLIFERNRKIERGGSSGRVGYGGGMMTVDYYFDDVMLHSLHPDGKLHWQEVLHKKQYSHGDNAMFSSYFLLKTPSNLRFIFNDDIKVESTVSEYVVSGNGTSDRNSVMSTDDQKIQLRFAYAMQVGSKELIVPSVLRNKMKLIRVKF